MASPSKHFGTFGSGRQARGIRRIALALALALIAAVVLPIATPKTALAFCEKRTDGSTCHRHMVETSMPFLRVELVDHLRKAVLFPDDTFFAHSADHFDSCDFAGGTKNINNRTERALHGDSKGSGFSPADQNPDPFRGITQWAAALHGAQDFYAHSNWIEMALAGVVPRSGLGGTELVDSSLGPWTELDGSAVLVRPGVFHFNENVPSGWSTFPNATLPRTQSVTGEFFNVLISGEATDPTQDCANDLDVSHDALNKDNINRVNHLEAQLTAMRQTRHEWCRLLNLASADSDYRIAAVIMGLMVQPGESPHPEGTACAADDRGSIGVTVSIDRIQILDDHNNNGAGDLNLTLGLFTTDFRRSALSQAATVAVNDGGAVPASALPAPVSMCLDSEDELIATVQGWEDDGQPGVYNRGDDVLVGTTHRVGEAVDIADGAPLTLGSHTLLSDGDIHDLRVDITITNTGAGCRPQPPKAIDPPDVFTDGGGDSTTTPPSQRPERPQRPSAQETGAASQQATSALTAARLSRPTIPTPGPSGPTPPGVPVPYPNFFFDEADALFGRRTAVGG